MDDTRARELLAAERTRIETALADIDRSSDDEDGEGTGDKQLADQATELYDKSMELGNADDLREQLAAVERAEARLDEGTFGQSVESGEAIPDARLEIVPTAERTVDEQSRYERGS